MKNPSPRRSADDRGFRAGTGFFALLVVLLVAGILFELYRTSTLSIAKFGFRFWSGKTWNPVSGEFGALPFIWGTLYSAFLAMFLSTPVALGIAVFLSELSPRPLRTPLAFLTELLAAIPSIVYGLWGVFVLVPLVRRLEVAAPPWMRKIPLFSGPPLGVGMGAAALILAVMVIPFTSSVAREVLRAVPATQREAAYALGATRWEAIQVALRYGKPSNCATHADLQLGRGVEPDATAMRDRIVRVLRAELVPVAVDSARFDRVMAGR